jgi:hypothetical protein
MLMISTPVKAGGAGVGVRVGVAVGVAVKVTVGVGVSVGVKVGVGVLVGVAEEVSVGTRVGTGAITLQAKVNHKDRVNSKPTLTVPARVRIFYTRFTYKRWQTV